MANPWDSDPVVQSGVQIKPANPKIPYEAPQAAADLTGTGLSNMGKALNNRIANATLPSVITKTDADAIKAKAEADAALQKQQQSAVSDRNRKLSALLASDTVLKAIGEAKNDAGWSSTGMMHWPMSFLPGSNAYNLDRALQTVEGNIAFNQYTQMKENMPEGAQGGLRLTDNELKMLKTLQGNLDPGQGKAILLDHLNAVEQQYRKNAALASGLDPSDPKVQQQFGINAAAPNSMMSRATNGALVPAIKPKPAGKVIDFKDLP